MSEVSKVLEKWGTRTIQNMKKVLANNRKVNTGRLYNSIQYVLDTINNTFTITMIGYGKFVDSGRRPYGRGPVKHKGRIFGINNRFPPINAIKEWLSKTPHGRSFLSGFKTGVHKKNNIKTINSAAYLVARSIAMRGIKPVKFLNRENKIKNVTNVYGSFKTDLKKAVIKDAQNNLPK